MLLTRPRVAATFAASFVLLAGTFAPVWGVWGHSSWESNEYPGTLRDALESLSSDIRRFEDWTTVWELYSWNFARAGVFFGLAAGVSYATYWWMCRRERAASLVPTSVESKHEPD